MSNLTPNFFTPASPNNWIYNRFRIPPKPPVEDTVSQPGRLCWGSVGALPAPQPMPMVGFQTVASERHTEVSRKTDDVRITNPDDPTGQTYVIVARSEEILFKKNHTTRDGGQWISSNTDGAADFGDFAPTPIELSSFKPLGAETEESLVVKFNNTASNVV